MAARSTKRQGIRPPKLMADLLPQTLRELGLPSKASSERFHKAWAMAAEPRWAHQTRLISIEGGVLTVGVTSAPLRAELENFHRTRLLDVLRTALQGTPLVGLRFVADASSGEPA